MAKQDVNNTPFFSTFSRQIFLKFPWKTSNWCPIRNWFRVDIRRRFWAIKKIREAGGGGAESIPPAARGLRFTGLSSSPPHWPVRETSRTRHWRTASAKTPVQCPFCLKGVVSLENMLKINNIGAAGPKVRNLVFVYGQLNIDQMVFLFSLMATWARTLSLCVTSYFGCLIWIYLHQNYVTMAKTSYFWQ